MRIEVRLFAQARERVGSGQARLELPDGSLWAGTADGVDIFKGQLAQAVREVLDARIKPLFDKPMA